MAQKVVPYITCHLPGYGLLEGYGWDRYVHEMLLGVAVCGTRNGRKDVHVHARV